jgi:dihydroxyacetone kinase-like predicted kinase
LFVAFDFVKQNWDLIWIKIEAMEIKIENRNRKKTEIRKQKIKKWELAVGPNPYRPTPF